MNHISLSRNRLLTFILLILVLGTILALSFALATSLENFWQTLPLDAAIIDHTR